MYNKPTTYEDRARAFRRAKDQDKVNKRELAAAAKSGGLSRDQYWRQCVRTKDDVKVFYSIYYPHYPDELVQAIADRLDRLVHTPVSQLTESERKQFLRKNTARDDDNNNNNDGNDDSRKVWNYEAELEEYRLAGKIALAEKRLEHLLEEEEENEKEKSKKTTTTKKKDK